MVAAAVAVHAMLHGLEAPADGSAALWWLGAFTGSVLVSGAVSCYCGVCRWPGPVGTLCCLRSAVERRPWGRSDC